MKSAKQTKAEGSAPGGVGRNERGDRRSRPTFTRTESEYDNTGRFGSLSRPPVVGVDPTVGYANRVMARQARKAERQWLRTLPKGVMV